MRVPDEEFYKHPIVNPRYFAKNYPELTSYLKERYPDLNSISEQLYWFRHNLQSKPICSICGGPVVFEGILKGYRKFCSVKCSRNSTETKNKAKQTCIERYGVDNPQKNKNIKAKAKQTCIERYGVDNPSKSPQIIQRINDSFFERHGVMWGGQIESVKNRIKQTCIERYGVGSGIETTKARQMRTLTNKQRMIERYAEIGDVMDGQYICKCPHPDCNRCQEKTYIIPTQAFFDRRRDRTEPCTKILPIKSPSKISGLELQVQLMLDKIGIKYEVQRNDLLEGSLQLDLYIPEYGIGIEVNGCYAHSIHHHSKDFDPDRQYKKYKICQEKGIRLISIWEDWLKNKPEIVESLLCSKFGIYNERIGARKCVVKPISTKLARAFIDQNHIQGYSRSKYKYGLFYGTDLVSVMTFSEPNQLQGNGRDYWVLNRFCTKLNTQIIGGAAKLLKTFIRDIHPNLIISYSSNDISDGSLYKALGFGTNGTDNQCYWYIKPGSLMRWHRTYFNKRRQLVLGIRDVDDDRTEIRAMLDAGYMVCYDTRLKTWYLPVN